MCQRAFELTAGHTPCRHPREGGDLVERLGDSRTCGNDGVAGRVASNARRYQARRGGIMAGHGGWAVPTHHSTRAAGTMVGSANPPYALRRKTCPMALAKEVGVDSTQALALVNWEA